LKKKKEIQASIIIFGEEAATAVVVVEEAAKAVVVIQPAMLEEKEGTSF
jgi:hypothetical protein